MLSQSMAINRREEHTADFVESKTGQHVLATQHTDVNRGQELSEMGLTELVSKFCRVQMTEKMKQEMKRTDRSGSEGTELEYHAFHPTHSLAGSHVLRERAVVVVPDTLVTRLPDREAIRTEDDREKYALIALILCFPFHSEKILFKEKRHYGNHGKV